MKVLKSLSVVISLLLIMTPALAFGQYSLNFIGFMPDATNPATKTEVMINGEGFVSGDITGVDVSTASSFSTAYSLESGFVVNENVMNTEDEIFGTISQPPATFPENDYYVKIHSTANGTVILGPIHFFPGGGGPQIWGGHFEPEGSITRVEIFGKDIPTDLTSVTVGGYTVTSVVVEPDTMMPGDHIILGIIAVDISTFSEGNYTVEITSTSKGTFNFDVWFDVFIPGPPSGEGIWHFSMHPDMGYIEVYIVTKDIPFDNIVSIEISLDQKFTTGNIYTVTSLEFEPEEGWEGSDFISGIINEAYKTFPSGDYYIRITMAAGDPYTWGTSQFPPDYVPTPPPLSEITFSKLLFIHYQPDTTAVIIYGEKFFGLEFETGVAIQLSDNASFTGNVYDLIIDDIEDEPSSRGFIVGLYPKVVTNFPAGDYYVKIIVPGKSPILSGALTTPAGYIPDQPVIYPVGSIFRGYRPGRTGFGVPGDLFDTITITSIEISDNSDFAAVLWTVDSIEVMPNEHGLVDEVKGVIHVDINDIPGGDYYVRITHSTGSIVGGPFLFTGWEGPPVGLDVIDLVFMGGGTGETDLDIVGHGFDPGDVTQVQVSRDGGFTGTGDPVYTLTSLNVLQGDGPEGADLITGTIPVDITSLPEGDYYVKLNTMSSGEQIFGPFYYEAGGGKKPEFFWVGIGAEGLDASIEILGENFDIFPQGAITSWRFTKDDSTFSGSTTIYEVTNITVEVNPDSDDRIFGIVTGLDPMTLEKGKYYAELTITGAPSPILIPFYFSPYGPPMFFDVDLFDEGTTTRVEMFGENLAQIDTADIYSMMLINDSTQANATIVWDVTDYYIVSYPDSIEKIVGYINGLSLPTLPQGDYWISVSAQCLIDAGFPDPTVYPFYWYGGGPVVEGGIWHFDMYPEFGYVGVDIMTKDIPLDSIVSIEISTDDQFITGVYQVTDLEFEPEEGWEDSDWIDGIINELYATFPAGHYYIKITMIAGDPYIWGTFEFPPEWVPTPPPISSMTFEKLWFAHFGSDSTLVIIEGENFFGLHFVPGITVEVSDNSAFSGTVYNLILDDIEDEDNGNDMLLGFYLMAASNFAAGDYYVRVTVPGDPSSPVVSGALTTPAGIIPTEAVIYPIGTLFEGDEQGMTEVWFPGDLFDTITITSIEISSDLSFANVLWTMDSIEVIPDDYGAIDIIEGIVNEDINNIPVGNYYVRINHSGGPTDGGPFAYLGWEGPGPEFVEVYWFWMGSLGNTLDRMKIHVGGKFGPNDITAIAISMDQTFSGISPIYDVTEIGVKPEAGWENEDIANGFIEVGFNELELGSYFARVTTLSGEELTAGPFEFTRVEVDGFGLNPQPGGVVQVNIRTRNVLSEEITAAELSTDREFTGASPVYTVTDLKFIPATEPRRDTFRGIIHESLMNIPPGEYFLKVYTSSVIGDLVNGPLTIPFGTWPPLEDVVINDFGILYYSVDTTAIVLKGDAFRAFRVYDAAVQISADPSFSGTVYDVNLDGQSRQYYGPWQQYGYIPVDVTKFAGGEYYARVVTPGEPTLYSSAITIPAGFIPDQPVLYSTIDDILRTSSTKGVTNFRLGGDLLDQVTFEQVEVSSDPGFNPESVIYTVENVEIVIDTWGLSDNIKGTIPVGIGDIPPGIYYVRVSIAEGDPLISDGFQHYGEPIEVEIHLVNLDSEFGEIQMWFEGRNLRPENITQIDISTDPGFSAGSVIYPLINIEYHPSEGFEGQDAVNGVVDVRYADFLTGDYYVRVKTTTGDDVVLGPFHYEQEIFPLLSDVVITDMRFYHYDTGQTLIQFVGENFNAFRGATGATIQLSDVQFSNGNTIYTVEIVEIDDWGGNPDYMYGMTAASADEFAAGDYYIRISAPGEPDYTLSPVPAPAGFIPTGAVLYPICPLFDIDSEVPGVTDVVVFGDLLNTVAISSIDISMDPTFNAGVITIDEFNVYPDEVGDIDIIRGLRQIDVSEIPVGSYYVRLNTDAGPILSEAYFFGGVEDAETEVDVEVSMIALVPGLKPGETELRIYGENFEYIELTGLTFDVSQDSTFSGVTDPIYPVTGLRKVFKPGRDDLITGRIEVDFKTLPFGMYYLRVTSAVEGVVDKIYFLHKGQPKIMLFPNFLDFGLVNIDERDSMEVTIRNDGNDTLRVFKIVSSPSFYPTVSQLPEISPGDSVKNTIVFKPRFGAMYRDTIWFASNDLLRPFAPLFVRGKSTITDITPPVFLEYPRAVGIDTSSATIVFKTDEPTRAEVIYWEAAYIGTEIITTGQQAIPDTHKVVIDSVFSMWHNITLTGLSPGTGYSFIVSITDIHENRPTLSQASFFQTRALADKVPPVITSGPFFYPIDTSTVVINWYTDEIATSMIRYNPGDTLTFDEWNVIQSELKNRHEILLEGLIPDTIYSYQVGSRDARDNGPTVSGIRHFYTPARADIEPPNFIEQPQVIGVDTSNALIRFLTDEPSNTVIYYNVDSLFIQGIWLEYVDSSYVKWHRAVLSGLFPGTSYTFFAQTTDRNGNGPAESFHFNFKTKDMADTRPPVFLGFPTVIAKDTSSVTIGWVTDEISTSVIEYETAANFDSTRIRIEDPTLTKEHILTITNLMPAAKYIFIIRSVDAHGNEAVISRTFGFMTALRIDREAPIIFGKPHVAEKDTDRVVIKWETNERATSIVEIAVDTLFENPETSGRTVITDLELTRFHSVSVFGLTPNTFYAFRVGSEDGFGNGPVYSEPQIVRTLDVPDIFPPVIFGFPEVRIVDTATVAIRWKTNEISTRRVVYYAEGSEENVNIQEEQALSRDGVIILSDLIPATKYFFTVFSTDSKGNTSQKGPFEFTTPDRADLIPPVFMKFPAIANIDTSSFVIEWVTDENANAILEYFPVDDPSDTLTVDDQTLQLRHSIYVSGLAPGTQYQVRVLSFDQAGNGPLTSGWFTIRTRNLPDLTAPRILGFPVVMKTDTSSATIAWLTDEPASSEIEYALASQWSVNNLVDMISEFSRTNEITLTNLLPDSLYFYRIRLTDRFGNVSEFSPLYRFRTLALADIIPPAFVGLVHITEIDTNKATIRWRTNEASNSIVEIGTAEEWPDNKWMVVEQELTENHAVLIKDLTSDTRYLIRVRSIDANENASEFSAELRFKTLATPDTRPPVILGQPTERDIDTTSVTIIFGTDEPATSRIEVREANDTTKTFLFLDGELVRLHRIFVSGLRPNTEYGYRVSAYDANNNGPTVSSYQLFRTLESADITPPRVTSGPIVIGLTHHSATIKFITNEVSYVSVSFGTDITLGATVSELNGKTTHTIRLDNLADSTLYYFQLEGKDIKGNEFIYPPVDQERLSFRTKPKPVVQDVSKPKIIAGPIELDIEPYQMTILWQTDKLANSVVDFGTDTTMKETVTQDNETMVHRHKVRLTNLFADTAYFYRIRSRGVNNIEFASNIFTIRTPALQDTLPAIIVQGPIVTFLGSDNATIEWLTDKNSSSRVDFGVDHATLANFIKENEIEGVKRHQIKLTGLFPDTIYYYTVSSIASNGREIVSNLFSFKTLAEVDSLPPKFLAGPDATAIENTSATIEWITDELSTSKVEYGLKTPGSLNLTEVVYVDADAAGVIKHKAVLTGLTPGALYIFRVSSTDLSPERNEAVSRVKRFKTVAVQDIIPPRLLTGPIVDFTDRTAVFEWETDELSDSFVLIRKANTTDNFRKIGDERKVIKHIITVTNLNPGEEYEYEIASRDLAGNLMTWPTSNDGATLQKFMELRKVAQPPGGGGSFSTDQDPDTLQPIIIEGPTVVAKTSNSITLQWKTDERSDSFVDYGFTTAYGSIKGDATDVTNHSITLTNLTASMVYNFMVYSTDVDNNGPTVSGNAAVSTEAEADNSPPKITAGPVIESITDNQATIIWETDELSDTYVEFGTTTGYGSVRISTEDVKVHSITLTNLSSATTYHFRVSSTDISDNGPTTSADTTFTTEASPDVILPVITNVAYSAVTDKTATITFTTDELADTFVDYGILSTTEFKVGAAQDVFEHEITLTNLLPDTTYQFTVGSLDKSDNHSEQSPDFSFKTAAAPDTEAPAAPAGFTGVEGNAQVLVMWNPNTEEDLAGYNIYRKAGDDTTLIETLVADTFYYDDGLTNGATYDYFISAADNQVPYNESSTTSIVSLTPDESNSPSTPAQFFPAEGQRIRHDAINMSVENSTPPEGRSLTYEFVIAEEEDFFNQIAFGENIAEGSTYTIWFSGQELTHDQTYYWKARAYDGYFYSSWSGARWFIADTTVVTNVTLVDFWGEDNEGVVVLGWQTSRETNNAGFNIYRSLTENDGFEKINTNLINVQDRMYNYTDTDVEAGRYYYYRLESVSTIGFAEKLGTVAVEVTTPRTFKLYQNYPNPFNPNTTIKFELPRVERVRIKIYNILGQEVKELLDERKEAGYHLIMWDGRDKFERPVASGMYIYRIIAGEFVQAKKMLLIR